MRTTHKSLLHQLVVFCMLGFYIYSSMYPAWADAVANGANAGQEIGRQSIQAFSGSNASTTLQDLFPSGQTTSLEEVFGDDAKTVSIGIQANTKLQTESSNEGDAYRTLVDSNNRISPDLSNDPMFNQADKIRDAEFMDGFKQNFADCKRTEVFEEVTQGAHVAAYRTCERVVDQGGTQDFTHDYKLGVIEYVSGQPNYQSCGVGCMYVWVGTVGDNYWGGNCRVYEEFTRFRVINKDAIISAVIEQATFDDYFEIYFDDSLLWTHSPGVFPPETAGNCERATSWRVSPNKDVTTRFKEDDDVITFKTRTSVTGGGEGYARIRINYDPAKAIVDKGWGPEERLPMFDMINDGYCSSASISCTIPAEKDADGCVTENGVQVCAQHMPPAPHSSIDPFCKKANVTAQCSFYKGPMECYTDAQGVEQCPDNQGGNLNTCKQYEDNPSCGFVSQKCIKGAEGDSGSCYAYEEVWDCGYDTSYKTVVNTGAQIDCPGGAQCMGSACFDTSNTKSKDFAYAVAMLQVAQFAEHDLSCGGDGTDISEANTCKVFKGEAMECKKALGGYVDCCEAPEGVSILDYVNLTMNTLKMTSSLEALSRTGNLFAPGYWAAGSEAAISVGSSIIEGQWGSIIDNATGAFNDAFRGVAQDTIMSELQKWLMQQAYDAMVDMGATVAADAVFTTGADGAVSGLSSQAAMVVNIIGWVYMVYVIVDLLINIIWECEPKEFELGAKKETRQCSFVGSYCASKSALGCVEKRESYCCYGSVVGRIIQESAREQLGISYGPVESPSCDGLTPDQLALMDWDKVDLSEWIGMLNLAGRLPTVNTVSIDDLTGAGSGLGQLSQGEERKNTLDRNMERFKGFDVDAVKASVEADLRK